MDDHVLATFTRRQQAHAVLERATRAFPRTPIRAGDVDDELDALALGQRAEMDESIPMLAGGLFSGPLARGALVWGLVGLVVGALLTLPFAWIVDTDFPVWAVAIFFAMAGALGLASATFVLGGAVQAVKEGETTPEDPTAVIRADVVGADAEELMRFFARAGARSIWHVDRPVARPPTADSEAPRPLTTDPDETAGRRSDYDAGFGSDAT